jgi:ankyrin repeat protein
VDVPNLAGETPLHIASGTGNLELVKALINSGADLNAFNKFHETPLQKATELNQLSTVKALVEHGADLNTQRNDGWSPLYTAGMLAIYFKRFYWRFYCNTVEPS